MQDEANFIIDLYNLKESKKYQNIKIFENDKIVLALAWIGKVQASIGTSILLTKYDLDTIINIGIAGNINNKNANIWDVFLVSEVVQHDGYLPFDWEHLDYFKKPIKLNSKLIDNFQTSNFNFWIFKNSICATWDQFIADKEQVEKIRNVYNADVVEMEAFAIASTCREFGKLDNLIVIKAVSDSANQKALTDHEVNLNQAMENSIKVLEKFV